MNEEFSPQLVAKKKKELVEGCNKPRATFTYDELFSISILKEIFYLLQAEKFPEMI